MKMSLSDVISYTDSDDSIGFPADTENEYEPVFQNLQRTHNIQRKVT